VGKLNQQIIRELFVSNFSREPEQIVQAPGRVNLIGEHTDYNGGFVLPAAIDYYTYIAVTKSNNQQLCVIAQDFEREKIVVDLQQPLVYDQQRSWPNYIYGVIQQLQLAGFQLKGGDLLICGDIPAGAGLSSSAALEMALIRALLFLSGETIDPTQAALLGQAAENKFVGCNCGIMDQLISARGEKSSALLIDCENLSMRAIAIPQDWQLLIVHSGVKRGLVDSEYNRRRRQCESVAQFFNQSSLRQVSLPELLAAESQLDPTEFRRARHVLTENERTLSAADALTRGDMNSLAKVMAESHISMRDDFSITTPEIDLLVSILQKAGKGRAGARMTGGGFGGCVVSIAPAEIIPNLIATVEAEYQTATGCTPTIIQASVSAGAFAFD
jgi:galactokinase